MSDHCEAHYAAAEPEAPGGETVLQTAQRLTDGARRDQYGPAEVEFAAAAEIASALTGHPLTWRDIILAMIAVKLTREQHKHQRDNLTDVCGYVRLWSRCEGDEAEGGA